MHLQDRRIVSRLAKVVLHDGVDGRRSDRRLSSRIRTPLNQIYLDTLNLNSLKPKYLQLRSSRRWVEEHVVAEPILTTLVGLHLVGRVNHGPEMDGAERCLAWRCVKQMMFIQ